VKDFHSKRNIIETWTFSLSYFHSSEAFVAKAKKKKKKKTEDEPLIGLDFRSSESIFTQATRKKCFFFLPSFSFLLVYAMNWIVYECLF